MVNLPLRTRPHNTTSSFLSPVSRHQVLFPFLSVPQSLLLTPGQCREFANPDCSQARVCAIRHSCMILPLHSAKMLVIPFVMYDILWFLNVTLVDTSIASVIFLSTAIQREHAVA
jgi:hypothetical protein